MPGRHFTVLRRFGHRGSVLTGFACTCIAYACGIFAGYRPTFTAAYHVAVPWFGAGFLALAAVAFAGALAEHDAPHYAIGVAGATAWGLLIATHWTAPVGWTAAVSWWGIAAGLLLSSAWPNAPHRVRVPPLPDLGTLTGDDHTSG